MDDDPFLWQCYDERDSINGTSQVVAAGRFSFTPINSSTGIEYDQLQNSTD